MTDGAKESGGVMTAGACRGVTLGVLAGGAGRRLGGRDKGFVEIGGEPQIVRLLATLAAQADRVLVSANRSLDAYRALGVEVVTDDVPGYPGPLAGLVRLLEGTTTARLLSVPVDAMHWPHDLVRRLVDAAAAHTVAIAEDDDGRQPLIACYPAGLHANARAAFARGERSVRRWQAALAVVPVRFAGVTFGNRNLPD